MSIVELTYTTTIPRKELTKLLDTYRGVTWSRVGAVVTLEFGDLEDAVEFIQELTPFPELVPEEVVLSWKKNNTPTG